MTQREWHNEGGPAFAHGDRTNGGDPGMSLRDWFAGQALAAIAGAQFPDDDRPIPPKVAALAYEIADEMFEARIKRPLAGRG